MTPYVEFDESRVNVADEREMVLVLVLRTPNRAIIGIATDRAGKTIRRLFGAVLDRPPVADMCRDGNTFRGDYQTCIIRVWRKSESLAFTHGVHSPEQTYSGMLLDTCYAAKKAVVVTAMTGGPADSACQMGLSARAVFPAWPTLSRRPGPGWPTTSPRRSTRTATWRSAIQTSARSADTLGRAAPHMPVFISHHGMPGNTNNVERTVRGYAV